MSIVKFILNLSEMKKMPEPLQRPQRRAEAKAQSREALLDAAMALIPLRGLDVSLDEVCAKAGYTRGAFYQHFENRDALIAAMTGRVAEQLLDLI
jgi:AcrR family transcriptional regulator